MLVVSLNLLRWEVFNIDHLVLSQCNRFQFLASRLDTLTVNGCSFGIVIDGPAWLRNHVSLNTVQVLNIDCILDTLEIQFTDFRIVAVQARSKMNLARFEHVLSSVRSSNWEVLRILDLFMDCYSLRSSIYTSV